MEITCTPTNDYLVINFAGQLDTSTAPKAEMEVNKYLDNYQKIIFDLSKTTFVSSAGLRVFLATAKKLKASGGKFKVCNTNDVVKEILDISGFSTILDIQKTLEDALNN